MKQRKAIFLLILVLLAACGTDPVAGDFKAPVLGTVRVEAEAFRARISCPVSGPLGGVSRCGFRLEGSLQKEIPATIEDGKLQADVKGLAADSEYRVEAFLTNGDEVITAERISFRTDDGPETVDIPDPVFRRYILANFDTNEDEVLTVPEALAIEGFSVSTDSIYSLSGIEKMKNLRDFGAEADYDKGKLSAIDLSGCPQLEGITLNGNALTALDVSKLKRLKTLLVSGNPLLSIDLSQNRKLEVLHLNSTRLVEIPDLTNLPLKVLAIAGVAALIDADYLRNFPELESVWVTDYPGTHIDLSCNTRLNSVQFDNNRYLEELDLTAVFFLQRLDVRECPQLRRVLLRKGTTVELLQKDPHTEIVYVDCL